MNNNNNIEHHRYELLPGGAQQPVTPATAQEYLRLVARHLLVESVAPAVEVRFSLRGV